MSNELPPRFGLVSRLVVVLLGPPRVGVELDVPEADGRLGRPSVALSTPGRVGVDGDA